LFFLREMYEHIDYINIYTYINIIYMFSKKIKLGLFTD
jgi:hypothetical protein